MQSKKQRLLTRKKWRANNKDKLAAQMCRWRKRHPETSRKNQKTYYKNNKKKWLKYNRERKNRPSHVFSDYKYSARKRGFVFLLTIDEFIELIYSICHYCGTQGSHESRNGIDRKDNSKGYSKANCVSCCFTCNFLKGKKEYSAFVQTICKIAKHLCKE